MGENLHASVHGDRRLFGVLQCQLCKNLHSLVLHAFFDKPAVLVELLQAPGQGRGFTGIVTQQTGDTDRHIVQPSRSVDPGSHRETQVRSHY